jgi:sugar/nucleoside kinase (ribokinase family)
MHDSRGRAADKPFDLLVLGDCNPDLILSGDQLEPRFGQIERIITDAELTIGGSGSIMAAGAARLGLRTAQIGVVGGDLFGRYMTEALQRRGVDTSGIRVDPASKTGISVILDRGGDRAILTYPGTIAALGPDSVSRDSLTLARHIHVSSFFLQGALAPALPELLRQATKAGASTSVDPNWDPCERWDGGLKALLAHLDVFLPNREEVMRIADRPDPASAARELAGHGPLVAVKLGRDGALAVTPERELVEAAPVPGIDPIDTVGAGDSFDAGVLAGLLEGWSTDRALALGCACGALSTRARGGTAAQPTREEALAALGESA